MNKIRKVEEGDGVVMDARMTTQELDLLKEVARAMDVDPSPPGPGCRCGRCLAIGVIAFAVKKLPADELKSIVKDMQNQRIAIHAMNLNSIDEATTKIDDMIFENLKKLHARVLKVINTEHPNLMPVQN